MCCKEYSLLDKISYVLVLIGGVNWLFVGLFNGNVLNLFGVLGRLIEIIIGAGAGYLIYKLYLCWKSTKEIKPIETKAKE
jgi:hypothetical protein